MEREAGSRETDRQKDVSTQKRAIYIEDDYRKDTVNWVLFKRSKVKIEEESIHIYLYIYMPINLTFKNT
jgi:hypothetical protein